MNRNKKSAVRYCIFLLFIFLYPTIHGQIIEMKEIPATGEKTYLLQKLKMNYVDINSNFDIQIRKDTLRSRINKDILKGNSQTDALMAELKTLTDLSGEILKKTEAFNESFQQYSKAKISGDSLNIKNSLDKLKESLSSVAQVEEDLLDKYVNPNPWLYQKYNAMLNDYMIMPDIFRNLVDEMNTFLTLKLDSAYNNEGVFIQVGAWIITKSGTSSIHLEGFDDYPLGEFYVHPTYNLQLDDKQVKELENTQELLGKNAQSYKEVLGRITNEIRDNLSILLDPVKKPIEELLSSINNVESDFPNQPKTTKDKLNEIKLHVKEYQDYLESLIKSYRSENLMERDKLQLLMRFYDDQTKLTSKTKEETAILNAKVISLYDELVDANSSLISPVAKIKIQIGEFTRISESFNDLKSSIGSIINGQKFNSELLVFGDKVKKLSVENVPSSTYFSLKNTGKREPGDQVILKVGVGTPSMAKSQDMEVIYLNLLEAEPHLNMAVAYNFAWPVAKTNETPPNGPSYSILYKFRSRSPFYRNIFDIGLGLNFATFDFNKDNIPEIAAGFCTSLLRDYIEAGWGFNFNANTGYYFVGIRIPISNNSVYFGGSEK
ncbi:MAG: hypothetical protein R2750_02010 [Bacteroidales bacterium]